MDAELILRFEQAIRKDGRFPVEAYDFVQRGLDLAARRCHGDEKGEGSRHVTGQELCLAIRDLAVDSWGPLASEVLRQWNVHRTRDFGEMVYLMIDLGLMGRQDSDSISDFDDVFDFDSVFAEYHIDLDKIRI